MHAESHPADPTVVHLTEWLVRRFGGRVELAEPPRARATGFDSAITFVQFGGERLPSEWRRPLVVRTKPSVERLGEARRETACHEWLVRSGYPVPRVLEVFESGALGRPAQVMERAPGITLLDALARRPWQARKLLRRLAGLHAQLHELPAAAFPVADDLLDRRLDLTRRTASALDHRELRAGIDAVTALAPRLCDAPPAICHGDFHPLNVLVADDSATVIDWTDAGVGDRHGDVARTLLLFDVAWLAAGNAAERALLRRVGPWLGRTYRKAYEERLALDPVALRVWTPVHLLHGWSQVVALHAGLFDGETPEASRERVPTALIEELQRRFAEALAAAREG